MFALLEMKVTCKTNILFSYHRMYSLSINRVGTGRFTRTTKKAHTKQTKFLYVSQMYLVIFPEGTRYNPELTKVISASQTFAAQEGK